MEDDIIEKPTERCLYRQSSLETRLSPIHLSEESDSDNSCDEEIEKICRTPKIIDSILKPNFDTTSTSTEPNATPKKILKNAKENDFISVGLMKGKNKL